MKGVFWAVALAAVVGCESGRSADSIYEQALREHQQAVAEHDDLIRRRDAIDAGQEEVVAKLSRLAETAAHGPAADMVEGIHADIAEERQIQREYAEEFDAKIAVQAKRVAETKAALEAAE